MDNNLELLKNNFYSALGLEESIFILLETIKSLIPMQRIFCYNVNRVTKEMDIFIDYSPYTKHFAENKFNIQKIFGWDKLNNMMKDKVNMITINNNSKENKEIWEYVHNFPVEFQSSCALYIYTDQKKSLLRVLTITHQDKNIFTDEHIKILKSLRPIICELINNYYNNKPYSYLTLSSDNQLPASPEKLLRNCKGLDKVMYFVDLVAPTQSNVLIQGETGSGKELIAETIHALSNYSQGPLIKVNCGAIPETLLDSEFFGAEKGAFTGAVSTKIGYFEQANNGTIYLDEIGELSLAAQVRLLRVLEHKEVMRVGGTRSIPIKTRVIAATHRDLWKMVEEGKFREDLCYRLQVFPILIPPLAERKEDIPTLTKYFYKLSAGELYQHTPPQLTRQTIELFCNMPWKGNVRQLRYTIERAMILNLKSKAKELRFDEVLDHNYGISNQNAKINKANTMILEIQKALKQSKNRIQGQGGAAEILGIKPSTLRSRIKKFNIQKTND